MRHILVPTDFSDISEHALETALEWARAWGSRVTLVHVWSLPAASYAEGLNWPIDEMERGAEQALGARLERARKTYENVETVLRQGVAWREILAVARDQECDLIVLGTHGRHGLTRLVLGSVAEKVLRLAKVPVLTVTSSKRADR